MKKNQISLRSLAMQPAVAKAEARALGIFVDDRELLACPRCGLSEDVDFTGRLLTSSSGSGEDTALRFLEIASGKFRCPKCRETVAEPPEISAANIEQKETETKSRGT